MLRKTCLGKKIKNFRRDPLKMYTTLRVEYLLLSLFMIHCLVIIDNNNKKTKENNKKRKLMADNRILLVYIFFFTHAKLMIFRS